MSKTTETPELDVDVTPTNKIKTLAKKYWKPVTATVVATAAIGATVYASLHNSKADVLVLTEGDIDAEIDAANEAKTDTPEK